MKPNSAPTIFSQYSQGSDYVDSSLVDMRLSGLPIIWEHAADLSECLLNR